MDTPTQKEELNALSPASEQWTAPAPQKPVELQTTELEEKMESSPVISEDAEAVVEPKDQSDSDRLMSFLKSSLKFSETIPSLRREKKDLAHNAARAVSHAFNEWLVISEGLQKKPKPKIVKKSEEQLILYWNAAALAIAQFDEEYARSCESIGEIFARVSKLSKVDLKKLSPRLEETCKRFETLLSPRLWVTGQTGRPVPESQD